MSGNGPSQAKAHGGDRPRMCQTIAVAAELLRGEAHDQRLHASSQGKGRTGSDPNVRVSAGRNRASTLAAPTEPSRTSGREATTKAASATDCTPQRGPREASSRAPLHRLK